MRLTLDGLVALAAHEGIALVVPGDDTTLGLRISRRAAGLITEHMSSTDGVGLGDVLRVWARRVTERPSLIFTVVRPVPAESVLIDLSANEKEVRVRRQDEADGNAG